MLSDRPESAHRAFLVPGRWRRVSLCRRAGYRQSRPALLALAVCSDLAARACAAVSTLAAVPSFRPLRLAAARAARDNREAREGRPERGRDDPLRRMFCASAIPAGSRLIGWAPAKRERNATCFVPVLLHAGRQVDLGVLQRPLETADAGRVALAALRGSDLGCIVAPPRGMARRLDDKGVVLDE